MPVLRSSPASPFGRKVKIAAAVLGLSGEITVEMTDTTDPNDSIRKQNPLGKIPALVLDDGKVLYDSRVIVEYLDHLAGGGKVLPQGPSRFDVLTLQALANGLMDASILQVYETRFRPEERRDQDWARLSGGQGQAWPRDARGGTAGNPGGRGGPGTRDRSLSHVHWDISTFASKAHGARSTRVSLPGSRPSRRPCPPTARPASTPDRQDHESCG